VGPCAHSRGLLTGMHAQQAPKRSGRDWRERLAIDPSRRIDSFNTHTERVRSDRLNERESDKEKRGERRVDDTKQAHRRLCMSLSTSSKPPPTSRETRYRSVCRSASQPRTDTKIKKCSHTLTHPPCNAIDRHGPTHPHGSHTCSSITRAHDVPPTQQASQHRRSESSTHHTANVRMHSTGVGIDVWMYVCVCGSMT